MNEAQTPPDGKPDQRPFAGIRVIDITHVLAGPACAYQLALLGADVIKVEELGRGDTVRNRGGSAKDLTALQMGTNYLAQNANKRSIAIDLKSDRGRETILRLAKTADVLLENHRGATMANLGLGPEDCQAVNPKLVYCSMSGYGGTGPRSNDPAYDVNIQAASGIMWTTGPAAVAPVRTGAPIMDYATGLAGAFAISAALFQRQVTGVGKVIDISMLEVGLTLMTSTVTDYMTTGTAPRAKGNAANSGVPTSGNFETADGLLSLGINEEHQFTRFARAIGRADWLKDKQFATFDTRAANAAAIKEAVATELKARPAFEWEKMLLAEGVPAAAVRTLPQIMEDPQIAARDFLHRLPAIPGTDREAVVPLTPFRFADGGNAEIDRPPPRLGEHSAEVLREAGYDEVEIDRMFADGVVT